jgi:hypothetical protein
MALTFKTAGDIYPVCSIFNGIEQMNDIDSSCARQLNDLDVGRIGKPHGT